MIKKFIQSEAFIGVLLLLAVFFACVFVNSSFSQYYYNLFDFNLPLNLSFVGVYKEMSTKLWIDDALMAIFFLFIGLELKKEFLVGELSSISNVIIPAVGAAGGVIVPALIYYIFNYGDEIAIKGWAIPAATDIAFAIGVISFFGNKIPNSLKVFLVTLAVVDDIIAILIIAFFYTENLKISYLAFSLIVLSLLFLLNKKKVSSLTPYLLLGSVLWIFFLMSGVHATIAGILLAFFIPFKVNQKNLLDSLEHLLKAPVNYFILPIFAFANSGIVLSSLSFSVFQENLVIAIILGLFLGKQLGICSFILIATKLKIIKFFPDVRFLQFYGVSTLAGIGFTMSLFIGGLAFSQYGSDFMNKVVLGIICGSLISMIFGIFLILLDIFKSKNVLK
jgi:NhaA family Na+:H+ antiporter